MFKYNIYIYIYTYHVYDIYIYDICIYYIYYTYIHIIHHIYKTSDPNEKINNWVLQFLENETKTFLDFQKIFYLRR